MKNHILKCVASVVAQYPQNSAIFSVLTLIILHLQIIANFFIGYSQKSQNFVLETFVVNFFRIFNLQILSQEFPSLSNLVLILLTVLLVFNIFFTLIIKFKSVTRHIWYWTPCIAPVIIGISAKWFILHGEVLDSKAIYKLVICCMVLAIWVVRRIIFFQTFGQANMSVHREIYIWYIVITVGNQLIFILTRSVGIQLIFSFCLIVLIIIQKLSRFSNVYPQVQYADLVLKFVCLGVSCSQIINHFGRVDLLFVMCIMMICIFLLEKTQFLKNLLAYKYIFLCKNSLQQRTSDVNLIILIILLSRKKIVSFRLGFEDYLEIAYIQILSKIGVNSFDEYSIFKRQYLFEFLQNRYLQLQSEDMSVFLGYWFMHYKMFIKAVKYTTFLSQHSDSFNVLVNSSILAQKNLLFLNKCQLLNVKEEEPSSHSLCKVDLYIIKQLNPRAIFIRQQKLQDFIKMVNRALQDVSNLNHSLMMSTLKINKIEDEIKKIWKQKNIVNEFINCNFDQFKHKQFLVVKYLFDTICCHQKYMVFENLQKVLLSFSKFPHIESIGNDELAVIISGESNSVGIITAVNRSMRQFFNLSLDKVRCRSENINQILPRQISLQHNNFIYNFKKRGTSKFIGKSQNFVVLKQDDIYKVNAYIKIYQHMDELMFAGRLRLIECSQSFILYDINGSIQNYSKDIDLGNTKDKILNIYDIIQPDKEKNISFVQNLNFLQMNTEGNQKMNKDGSKRISENVKMNIRKSYSSSKLKGNFNIKIKNQQIKTNFDYFQGQKYFQGICTLNRNDIQLPSKIQSNLNGSKQKDSDCKYQENENSYTLKDDNRQQNKQYLKDQSSEENRNEKGSYVVESTRSQSYFQMQRKIGTSKMFANSKIILLIVFIVLFYLVAILCVSFMIYQTQSRIDQMKTLLTFHYYTKNQRASYFQIGTLIYLMHGINIGKIQQIDGAQYGYPHLSTYFKKSSMEILEILNRRNTNVSLCLNDLPTYFLKPYIKPIFPSTTIESLKFTFFQMNNYIQYPIKQLLDDKPSDFEQRWEVTSSMLDYYFNQFFNIVDIQVTEAIKISTYQFISDSSIKEQIIKYIFLAFIIIAFVSIMCVFYHLNKEKKHIFELLSHIQNKQLIQDFEKIKNGLLVINQLSKYQIDGFFADSRLRTLQFKLFGQRHQFTCSGIKSSQLLKQSENAIIKQKKKLSFTLRKIKQILNISMFLIVMIGFFFCFYIYSTTAVSISNNTNFFMDYLKEANQNYLSQAGLMLAMTQTFVLGRNNQKKLVMRPLNQAVSYFKKIALKRKQIDILVKTLPWESVKRILFDSACLQKQSACEQLIQSSFTHGMNSAFVYFTLQSIVLLDQNSNNDMDQLKQKLLPMVISNIDIFRNLYINSMNQNGYRVFDLFSEYFSYMYNIYIFGGTPILILCIIATAIMVFLLNRDLKLLTREILSLLTVDVLNKQMQFSYAIRKLK